MLIVFYTSTKFKNLLDLLPGNPNRKVYEGQYHLEELAHQKQNIINATDFIFLRQAFMEADNEEFLEGLKGFMLLYPEKRITLILQGETETDEFFINELINLGVYNIAAASNLSELREEIAECLSVSGMERYKPKKTVEKPQEKAADELPVDKKILNELAAIKKTILECKNSLTIKLDGLGTVLSDISVVPPKSPDEEKDVEIQVLTEKLAENEVKLGKLAADYYEKESRLQEDIRKRTAQLLTCEQNLKGCKEKVKKYEELITEQKSITPLEQANYNFSGENIHIGLLGAEARIGVTNTALALAKWIVLAGGRAAYVEENLHNHFANFAVDMGVTDSADEERAVRGSGRTGTEFGYVWEGVDIHLKAVKHIMPHVELDKDYNFIIHDFGQAKKSISKNVPERDNILEKMDILILVGGFKEYEQNNTLYAIRLLKHKKNLIFALNFVHESDHERLKSLFTQTIEGSVFFINYMPYPEFPLSNQSLFEHITQKYI